MIIGTRSWIFAVALALPFTHAYTGTPPQVPPAPLILSGRIVDDSAQAVAGAQLQLLLTDVAGTPVGGRAKETLVARGQADASGQYLLRAEETQRTRAARISNGGILNLEVRVAAPGHRPAVAFVSRSLQDGAWIAEPAPLAVGRSGNNIAIPSPRLPIPLTLDFIMSHTVGSESLAVSVGSYCSWYRDGADYIGYGSVFEIHSVTKTTVTWHYSQQASSVISINAQYGPGGSWQVIGNYGVGNVIESEAGQTYTGSKHTYAATGFKVSRWVVKPDNPSATYCTNIPHLPGARKAWAYSWSGGATNRGSLPSIGCTTASPYSVEQGVKSYFIKKRGNSGTLSAGLPTPWGTSLNISSSWGDTRSARWDWSTAGAACGNNDLPPYSQFIYVG